LSERCRFFVLGCLFYIGVTLERIVYMYTYKIDSFIFIFIVTIIYPMT